MRNVSFSVRAGFNNSIIWLFSTHLHGIKILWWVCSNRGEISARFTLIKLLHIIVVLVLHYRLLTCESKSHHDLKKLKFQLGLKISLQLAHEMQLFTKIVNHFRKRLHLRSLTVF